MNRYMKRAVLFFFVIVATSIHAQYKNNMDNYPKYTIAVQPFYLLNGGLRFDFEKQLNSPKNWLQLSISGYHLPYQNSNWDWWETPNSNYDPISKLNGLGAGAAYKSIFYSTSVYYSAGLSYTHYRVTYSGADYHKFVEDGLTYYEYYRSDQKQIFNKLTASLCLGIQSTLNNLGFFDAYLGLGYSHSFYDASKRAFDDNQFGYGYRGLHVTGGVRFGITFGR
ncbi:MAG: hypothetical protein ACK5KT_02675 [Dysgonomonas sp.]